MRKEIDPKIARLARRHALRRAYVRRTDSRRDYDRRYRLVLIRSRGRPYKLPGGKLICNDGCRGGVRVPYLRKLRDIGNCP